MRHIVFMITAILATSAFCSGLYVPKGSEDQLAVSPLHNGELCWLENAEGSASLYVGTGSPIPYRVTDTGALRGVRTRTLLPGEYSVSAGGTFVQNGNTWRFDSAGVSEVTNTIIVSTPSSIKILTAEVHYNAVRTDGGLGSPQVRVDREIDGSVARFTMVYEGGPAGINPEITPAIPGYVTVTGFTVTTRALGEIDIVNDTSNTVYTIRDRLGKYSLYDLRYWATHLYDGNRGEDWSDYKAKNSVLLEGHTMFFDSAKRYRMQVNSQTNLVIAGAGRNLVTIRADGGTSGGDVEYTVLEFTGITIDSVNKRAVLTFHHDITGYDPENLELLYCDHLENGGAENFYSLTRDTSWYFVDESTISVDCMPEGIDPKRGFWRLRYDGVLSSVLSMTVDVPLYVTRGLFLTGTDGKVYQVNVSGGTGVGTDGTAVFTQVSE